MHFFWAIDFLTIDAVAQRYLAVLHVEWRTVWTRILPISSVVRGECRLLAASLPTQSDDAVQILVKLAAELDGRAGERADPKPSADAAAKMDRG